MSIVVIYLSGGGGGINTQLVGYHLSNIGCTKTHRQWSSSSALNEQFKNRYLGRRARL